MKCNPFVFAILVMLSSVAYAEEQPSTTLPDISLPSLPNATSTLPPPPMPAVVHGGKTGETLTPKPPMGGANTPATPVPQVVPPKLPETTQNGSVRAVNKDIDLPEDLIKMLKEKNINISETAAEEATQSIKKEHVEQEKKKQEEEKRRQEEEHRKKIEEEQREQAMMPPVVHRAPYDHQVGGSPQLHKKEYGENNMHLPPIREEREYSQYLFVAVVNDDIGAIKTLLGKGADINSRSIQHGYTPLMYATQNRKYRAMSYLLTHGAAVDVIGFDGKNALQIATDLHDSESIGLLTASGAMLPPQIDSHNVEENTVIISEPIANNYHTPTSRQPVGSSPQPDVLGAPLDLNEAY